MLNRNFKKIRKEDVIAMLEDVESVSSARATRIRELEDALNASNGTCRKLRRDLDFQTSASDSLVKRLDDKQRRLNDQERELEGLEEAVEELHAEVKLTSVHSEGVVKGLELAAKATTNALIEASQKKASPRDFLQGIVSLMSQEDMS